MLFAVDATGALLTAVLLWLVVRPYPAIFGMPSGLLSGLVITAVGLVFFGCCCFLWAGKRPVRLIRILAGANLLYCLSTLILLFVFQPPITGYGILYFTAEILLVGLLVRVEWAVAAGLQKMQEQG